MTLVGARDYRWGWRQDYQILRLRLRMTAHEESDAGAHSQGDDMLDEVDCDPVR
jgi:hypothetical protein